MVHMSVYETGDILRNKFFLTKFLSFNSYLFLRNQLLFAVDTALVADSEEKLCRLESELVEYVKEGSWEWI